jgi:nitrogen fixation protein NifU and related proteins
VKPLDNEYSDQIIEYFKRPVNFGKLEPADIEAAGGNPSCGDSVVWTMRINDNKITEILFTGRGCAISRASACVLSEMVKGKKIAEAQKISKDELFAGLGGIIMNRLTCALLPLKTLQAGLAEYEKKGAHPVRLEGVRVQ